MNYHKGQRLKLTKPQTDDDDGTERTTPAGSIVEIVDVIPENTISPYAVACPETGGSWFFSAAELDAETSTI